MNNIVIVLLIIVFLSSLSTTDKSIFVFCMTIANSTNTVGITVIGVDVTNNIQHHQSLSRTKKMEGKSLEKQQAVTHVNINQAGSDEVSNTADSIALRNYKLREKKSKGIFYKRPATMAEILFPNKKPELYTMGEYIAIYTDLVNSRRNPIPYNFYDIPFCYEPTTKSITSKELQETNNLGSLLQGHTLKVVPFDIQTKVNRGCTVQCVVTMDDKTLRWIRKFVHEQYNVHLLFDDLPVLRRSKDHNYAVRGYPIGFQAPHQRIEGMEPGEYYLYNHLRFTITYHESNVSHDGVHITGFDVLPVSYDHRQKMESGSIERKLNQEKILPTCNENISLHNDPKYYLKLKSSNTIDQLSVVYSYEVEWLKSDLEWADRWDVYVLNLIDDNARYFSIVNSLVTVIIITFGIGLVVLRVFRKTTTVYNEMKTIEESVVKEAGWRVVAGDVFRPPTTMPMMLCVLVGTGVQICVAFGIVMLAAMIQLFNPLERGQTLTQLLQVYALCGIIAGYVSSRLYQFTEQKHWKTNLLVTATALPGTFLTLFMILNVWLSVVGAATAVSVFTIMKLFLVWICVLTPSVYLGGIIGYKSPKMEVPVKTNEIARVVPTPVLWYTKHIYIILISGIIPASCIYIEFILSMLNMWLHQWNYGMGFVLSVFFILIVTCAQISIILTYLQLCHEDHRWWWTSYLRGASPGIYFGMYCIWFLQSKLQIVGILPLAVYITYMGMICICFTLACGSIGFVSAFLFTRKMYGTMKESK